VGMNTLFRPRDPRYYQIAVLGTLVTYGVTVLEFGIHWYNAVAILVTAMAVQFAGTKLAWLDSFDPRSPLITALSLTLLLRTDQVLLAVLAAAIAIGSKFLVRVNGKHVFNPANVALVPTMLITDRAWVSSGQWGSTAIVAFALACLGLLVLTHAKRAETTVGFLAVYAGLLFGRALWLEDPWSIPLHQIQNGALLLFAFFMISDPKTTPNTARGRYLFSGIVAVIAFAIQFVFYEPNGPILALVILAPLVPLIDALSRGQHYQWCRSQPVMHQSHFKRGEY
jgi:Na+-transporting NADH:ubiquinone oxidoreductase subunit NqrB